MLEELIQTPSEYESRPDFVLSVMPGPWDVDVHNDQGEGVGRGEIASPGRARRNRGQIVSEMKEIVLQMRDGRGG